MNMKGEDMLLVEAICEWLANKIESGEAETIKDNIETFRREYERKKYVGEGV